MKFLLSLIICSQVAGTCMPPYPWPKTFDTTYDCMVFGYEESLKKIQDIKISEIKNLIDSFNIKNEKFIQNSYSANFEVNFNKNKSVFCLLKFIYFHLYLEKKIY